jgi:hypothetical protein
MRKRIAEALVECGYKEADSYRESKGDYFLTAGDLWVDGEALVQPFADTLEGRRQADALEDWLIYKGYYDEFDFSKLAGWPRNFHQWRLDRIKRCFEELLK